MSPIDKREEVKLTREGSKTALDKKQIISGTKHLKPDKKHWSDKKPSKRSFTDKNSLVQYVQSKAPEQNPIVRYNQIDLTVPSSVGKTARSGYKSEGIKKQHRTTTHANISLRLKKSQRSSFKDSQNARTNWSDYGNVKPEVLELIQK